MKQPIRYKREQTAVLICMIRQMNTKVTKKAWFNWASKPTALQRMREAFSVSRESLKVVWFKDKCSAFSTVTIHSATTKTERFQAMTLVPSKLPSKDLMNLASTKTALSI